MAAWYSDEELAAMDDAADRQMRSATVAACSVKPQSFYPACKSPTSACRGGRRLCPTPQACCVQEPEHDATGIVWGPLLGTLLWSLAAILGVALK